MAIARALVNKPRVLLLDEPLGALDLQLRRQMQVELKRLQKRLDLTFLYITHDQEEALNMSDRIVVMRDGRFQQIGSPAEVYDRPRTAFVARFVGSANILRGTAQAGPGGTMLLAAQGGAVPFLPGERTVAENSPVTVAVRSEQIRFEKDGKNGIPAVVKEKSFTGGMLRIAFVARFVGSANILRGTAQAGPGGTMLLAAQGGAVPFLPGERTVAENSPVTVAVRSEQIRFEKDGKNGIPAVVKEKSFTGGMLRIAFAPDSGEEVVASRHGIDLDLHPGERVALSWDPAAAVVVEEDAG